LGTSCDGDDFARRGRGEETGGGFATEDTGGAERRKGREDWYTEEHGRHGRQEERREWMDKELGDVKIAQCFERECVQA